MTIPKFRAWDKITRQLLPVESILLKEKFVNVRLKQGFWASRAFYEIELMQSTGLYTVPLCPELDYERKEIFEGDILKWYYSEGIELEQQGTFVVVFENGAFRPNKGNDITLHEMLEDCDWAKVIGNIYENPELVEEEK